MEYVNYFEILGVTPDATKADIFKAYRRLSRLYHPDLNPDDKSAPQKILELNEAFCVLTDEEKRQAYLEQIRPVDSVQDLLLRHPSGRNFTQIILESAPKAPKRGVDLLIKRKVGRQLLQVGGAFAFEYEMNIEGKEKKEKITVTLPPNIGKTPWLCLKNFGTVGKNGGERGDLWVYLSAKE